MKFYQKNTWAIMVAMALILVAVPLVPVYGAHWADPSLSYLESNKMLPDNYSSQDIRSNFDKPINRSAVLTLLVYGIGEKALDEKLTDADFKDWDKVPDSEKKYVAAAKRLKILAGSLKNDGLYINPNSNITRQEASTMIARALGMQIDDVSGLKDDDSIATWAKSSVTGMNKGQIIIGDNNQYFNPTDELTWGQMMSILEKAHKNNKMTQMKFEVVAGSGIGGHLNGNVKDSQVSMPKGITVDASGVLYFADYGNNLIRSINKGTIADYAGIIGPRDVYNMSVGGYIDAEKDKSLFNKPMGIKAVKDGLLVADSENNSIRLITDKTVRTFAGTNKQGHKDGDKNAAMFNYPTSITVNENGEVFISDTKNHVIRKIDSKNVVTTIAGTPGKSGFADGNATDALLCEPMGLAYYKGSLYIADSGNNRIRLYKDGKLTTYAGGGTEKAEGTPFIIGDYADGSLLSARFDTPTSLGFDTKGNLYVADKENGMIRVISNGVVSTFAGFGNPINAKAPLLSTYLVEPTGILVTDSRIYVTDSFTNHILSFQTK